MAADLRARHYEVEARRRDYVENEMKSNPAWAQLVHPVDFDGHPALVLMGYDHDCVLALFTRITDGQATKLIKKAFG